MRLTGDPLELSNWNVPVHGLAKLFDHVLLMLEFCDSETEPVSLTAPTNVSAGIPGPETKRPVSSALIRGSMIMLEPFDPSAGSDAEPGEPLRYGLSPVSPVGRSMNPEAPGPGWSC